ncbi:MULTISPECIES: D-alanyl-D-alanine carboxypeptidase/D-alanyl-D-alanine endopeptidase [Parafrankia]|uniref:D-alanyl-D-alanine carboxypeptidase/D-alanyl-D-alanine endopeptidase n=1 Tax=Parafrankia TaxID=2994362 RepID=UPI000B82C236|nr:MULTISPECIES: D-alanyl-D-alanine carboxypeptidase/D-alanyl-D-alanine-endopeptidase [Parafrankia]MBE3204545.1 D-alanyl-D-alanine carboxypeptidase/D-alanyl-D-alanine-endopeptidase [Parafrankia sp. CH37]
MPLAARTGGLTALAGALLAGSLSPTPGPTATPGSPASPSPGTRVEASALPGLDPDAPQADSAAVTARLTGPLADPVLGNPAALVVDALTGQVLFAQRSTEPTAPASTIKIATATAALTTLAPDKRLVTRAVYLPPAGGSAASQGGTLWLVGGGDPTLTASTEPVGYPPAARLSDLAKQVHDAGITSVAAVIGDGTAYEGPAQAAGWRDGYVTDGNVTPVSALEVDAGRRAPGAAGARTATPDAAAAGAFASALRTAGVSVGTVATGRADAGAQEIASVQSPTIPVLVERMLTDSDNDLAESLGRQVAIARGLPATFAGASAGVLAALRDAGIPTDGASLQDTSGLSIEDRIAPATLVAALRTAVMPGHPALRTVLSGLPVAGFTGTLGDRYSAGDTSAAAGVVRAKTGSLRIVTSLAGMVTDADGRLLLFGLFAPVEEQGLTKMALDRVATALASCGCSATTSTNVPSTGGEGAAGASGAQTPAQPSASAGR